MITLIWAQTKKGIIGYKNSLPWKIKEEMQFFINYTKQKTILMGRNTWESLQKKPLPNRKNIVLTSKSLNFNHKDVIAINNLDFFLNNFKNDEEELIIIGGRKIYDSSIAFANKLVISFIYKEYQGDVYAPKIDTTIFKIISIEKYNEFEVRIYERKINDVTR